MLYMDKCVRTALLEEGQTLLPLSDLGITDDDLNDLFENTYEQARPYAQSFVRKSMSLSTSPVVITDAVAIKRVSYDLYMDYNRITPDIPQSNWDFNPHTRELRTFASTRYVVEYLAYPKCDYFNSSLTVVPSGTKTRFSLPCEIEENSLRLTQGDLEATVTTEADTIYTLDGTLGTGEIDKKTLRGFINLSSDANSNPMTLSFTNKNLAIEEWDMKVEVFYIWFKANLLSLIGSIKEQAGNIDSSAMPFDINRDSLLDRARTLYSEVDNLKDSKSAWYEF